VYSGLLDGFPTTFGTSGLLYRSNKLMYDRATFSLWSQLLGEPVIGPLAGSGIKLNFFPSVLTTWSEWLGEHPDTTVLSPVTGFYLPQSYTHERDPSSIYFDYRSDPDRRFAVWNRDGRLELKAEILGLSVGDVHKAYPLEALRSEGVVNDVVGGAEVVIVASEDSSSTRVYARDGREFAASGPSGPGGQPQVLVNADGMEWKVTEEGLVSAVGPSITLPRMSSRLAFWFGWFAFHPDTLFYEAP
jgi:hypothetical protein